MKDDYNVQISFLPFGLNASVYSPFSIDNSFSKDGGVYVSDFDKLYNKLGSKNIISQEFSLPIFDIKIWTYYGQFEFGIRDNINSLIPIDKELVKFLNEGNAGYVGQTFSSSLNVEMIHFREFAFGYIHENLEDLWSYGVRLKILMGMGLLRSNMNYGIETSDNIEYLGLSLSGDTKVSFPLSKSYDNKGYLNNISVDDKFNPAKYMLGGGNLGIGIDMSIRYEGVKDWEFEFCAENLGMIKWTKNLNNIDAGGTYKWNGLDLSDILTTDGFTEFLDDAKTISVKDSIFSNLNIQDNEKTFRTIIPGSFLLSTKYMLNENVDLALINRLYYSNQFAQNSLAISGNFKFGKYFAISSGILFKGRSFSNLMLGCGINRKNISLFMGSDNIAAFITPANSKNFGLSFGMNYRFIHRTRIAKKLMKNMPFFRPSRF